MTKKIKNDEEKRGLSPDDMQAIIDTLDLDVASFDTEEESPDTLLSLEKTEKNEDPYKAFSEDPVVQTSLRKEKRSVDSIYKLIAIDNILYETLPQKNITTPCGKLGFITAKMSMLLYLKNPSDYFASPFFNTVNHNVVRVLYQRTTDITKETSSSEERNEKIKKLHMMFMADPASFLSDEIFTVQTKQREAKPIKDEKTAEESAVKPETDASEASFVQVNDLLFKPVHPEEPYAFFNENVAQLLLKANGLLYAKNPVAYKKQKIGMIAPQELSGFIRNFYEIAAHDIAQSRSPKTLEDILRIKSQSFIDRPSFCSQAAVEKSARQKKYRSSIPNQ